jgi:hypothetical protein
MIRKKGIGFYFAFIRRLGMNNIIVQLNTGAYSNGINATCSRRLVMGN